jgi:hypothetical protein
LFSNNLSCVRRSWKKAWVWLFDVEKRDVLAKQSFKRKRDGDISVHLSWSNKAGSSKYKLDLLPQYVEHVQTDQENPSKKIPPSKQKKSKKMSPKCELDFGKKIPNYNHGTFIYLKELSWHKLYLFAKSDVRAFEQKLFCIFRNLKKIENIK